MDFGSDHPWGLDLDHPFGGFPGAVGEFDAGEEVAHALLGGDWAASATSSTVMA